MSIERMSRAARLGPAVYNEVLTVVLPTIVMSMLAGAAVLHFGLSVATLFLLGH